MARVDPAASALGLLRIGLGVIWALNLIFVVDPANQFFATFSSTARSFGGATLGGPVIPTFVADHPAAFALIIAIVTAYLAVAFLLGFTTRFACFVGLGLNVALLLTQVGQVAVAPGGTDVGPQPLYLLAYGTLIVAGGRTPWSLDARWSTSARSRDGDTRRPYVTAQGAAGSRSP